MYSKTLHKETAQVRVNRDHFALIAEHVAEAMKPLQWFEMEGQAVFEIKSEWALGDGKPCRIDLEGGDLPRPEWVVPCASWLIITKPYDRYAYAIVVPWLTDVMPGSHVALAVKKAEELLAYVREHAPDYLAEFFSYEDKLRTQLKQTIGGDDRSVNALLKRFYIKPRRRP